MGVHFRVPLLATWLHCEHSSKLTLDCSFQDIEFHFGATFFFCNHISLHCCMWRFFTSFIVFFCFVLHLLLFVCFILAFITFCFALHLLLLCYVQNHLTLCVDFQPTHKFPLFFVCKNWFGLCFFWGACDCSCYAWNWWGFVWSIFYFVCDFFLNFWSSASCWTKKLARFIKKCRVSYFFLFCF